MNKEGILEDLRTEASCPVCLDFLKDPVTLDCGHHCCAACLQQRWQDLQDVLPCPVCQHHCAYRKLQKNSQLSALVDMLKQLSSRGSKRKKQQEQPLCEQHQQELSLFCEKDLELVCAQCRGSCEQQGHPLIPTQEAVAQHRKKLKSHLKTLRQQLEDASNGLEIQMQRRDQVREELKSQRIIACEMFEYYTSFFRENYRICKFELQEVMTNVSQKITESKDQMSAYSSSLKSLLSDLTKMSVQTDLGLLLKVRSLQQLLSRYKELEAPEAFSYTFQENTSFPLYYICLYNMRKFHVDLTLDIKTAHCNFIISEDRKKALFDSEMTVSNSALRPEAFSSHTAVLSCEGFEAGRHYWMVEIRGSGVCSLGVCKGSFPRQALGPQASRNDCWKIQQPVGSHFNSDKKKMIIGIFLDYELGEIWFYNMSEMCPICTITESFTERVSPYFSVDYSSSSVVMTII
ncbi:tripartite motif-containing protein 75-like [Erinaceus europaeus]|uniref:Tripartite motif-containing protein 75-like n=1 Tax=Erinaceus europaeus TaxID=9365 RepID=A0ABM3WNQ5_ERIEU|nr:tripartite motif-containing protein 75-like [Erinaceus europaeus]